MAPCLWNGHLPALSQKSSILLKYSQSKFLYFLISLESSQIPFSRSTHLSHTPFSFADSPQEALVPSTNLCQEPAAEWAVAQLQLLQASLYSGASGVRRLWLSCSTGVCCVCALCYQDMRRDGRFTEELPC